jgi:diaminohydroxyphosphoribosylaminopyrimidine deaminase/5-amino-6-(5-phosphoribosylamino)uracil reductase
VANVQDKSVLKESTIYVTLEPCSHFGRTPPCADLLIREGVKKVVVAGIDPNPLVAGKGIAKLRAAGIEVVMGVLEKEASFFNRRFLTYITRKRPYVILKWAQTSDGFIARENFDSKWISDVLSRQLVHKWRSEEDAVLVGSNTARHDNPHLNVRDWSGRDPLRVVIDRNFSLPEDLHLLNGIQSTLRYNTVKSEMSGNVTAVQLARENFLEAMMNDLASRKVQSVIVEGGATILNEFIAHNLWDEARVFTAPVAFQSGIRAPKLDATPVHEQHLNSDTLATFYNRI